MDVSRLLERASPEQREAVDQVAEQAKASAIRVYIAGGAVRDALMQRPITDVDFVVEGDAILFAGLLARNHGGDVVNHERFRTATWTISGHHHDLASTRVERYRRPGALPEVTTGVPIEADLPRRDFSLNAMAVRVDAPGLVDPFGGVADIAGRRVRALHPNSFVDDPTRILRAARYAVRYQFEVDEATTHWIGQGMRHIGAVSGERLKYDIERIFAEMADAALAMAAEWGVFRQLGIPVPGADALRRRFVRMRVGLSSAEFPVTELGLEPGDLVNLAGWGALVYNEGGFAISKWIDRIPFPIHIREALVESGVLSTLSATAFHGAKPSALSTILRVFGGESLLLGWLFDGDPHKRIAALTEWRDWRRVRSVVQGDDLRARGLVPGPQYTRLLSRLRDAWLDGEVRSPEEEAALLARLVALGPH